MRVIDCLYLEMPWYGRVRCRASCAGLDIVWAGSASVA